MIRRILATSCALLGIAGAAHAQEGEYRNIRTVGVASAIGDNYTLFETGVLVPMDTEEKMPIGDWHIDDAVSDKIANALSSRFSVRRVVVNPATVDRCNSFDHCLDAFPVRRDIDAYVVAVKRTIQLSARDGGTGLGQLHNPGPFGLHADWIYAGYAIVVVDARSGSLIDSGSARIGSGTGIFIEEPIKTGMPASIWPVNAAQMTNEQRATVKNVITDLLDKSLMHGLENANLIPPQSDK